MPISELAQEEVGLMEEFFVSLDPALTKKRVSTQTLIRKALVAVGGMSPAGKAHRGALARRLLCHDRDDEKSKRKGVSKGKAATPQHIAGLALSNLACCLKDSWRDFGIGRQSITLATLDDVRVCGRDLGMFWDVGSLTKEEAEERRLSQRQRHALLVVARS